jgi:phosphoadenosine phosphosulfate reductase
MKAKEEIINKRGKLSGLKAEEILQWSVANYGKEVVFASSMGAEDQVITDMISKLDLDIEIFTLDTGRLFNETYDLIAKTEERYNRKINVFFPDASEVENMVSEKGINLFYESIENRKRCCKVRKLEPLARALKPYSAWICGLRKDQSVTRSNVTALEWDELNSKAKVNPLIDWSEKDVWDYIKKNNVPYSSLHDKGFLSIGCACCTRAVVKGEDLRSGRWWWETPEQKECGLHMVKGKLVRKV